MISLKEHDQDQPAIICDGQTWTYGELDRRAVRVARNLAGAGLEPGDRIATLLPNCHELALLYLAAFHGGFTIAPLDARYNSAQINFALRHCGASVLVTHPGQLGDVSKCDVLRDVEHRLVIGREKHEGFSPFYRLLTTRPTVPASEDFRGDDVGAIFYTSGTTARPKGVTLTRDAISIGISKTNAVLRLQPEDVSLIAAPVSRPMALRTQLLPSAMRNVLFHPDLEASDLAPLRLAICGGDHVPADLFEQCGMTEAGMYAVNPPYGRKNAARSGCRTTEFRFRLSMKKAGTDRGASPVKSLSAVRSRWTVTGMTQLRLGESCGTAGFELAMLAALTMTDFCGSTAARKTSSCGEAATSPLPP